jgi:hypothetical protein
MTDPIERTPESDPAQTPAKPRTRRQRFVAVLPMGLALLLIAGVWAAGAVWSFEEQTRFARSNGFEIPELLPLVLDGMAVAMAAVAYAAGLDARPAVFARLGTALAIACSSASNAAWAWERSGRDVQTIVLAGGVPVVAMLAFEVLLAELRRQVLRRRGQPGPVAVTYPRLIRFVLAPWPTFVMWRRLVLEATDPAKSFGARTPIRVTATTGRQTRTPAGVESGPGQSAIADRPHQTSDPVDPQTPGQARTPERTPRQVRTPAASGLVRRPTPVRLVPPAADPDEPILNKLRDWQADNGGQVPSINKVQEIVGGGRSRAIRLRSRLTPVDDNDRAAV